MYIKQLDVLNIYVEYFAHMQQQCHIDLLYNVATLYNKLCHVFLYICIYINN